MNAVCILLLTGLVFLSAVCIIDLDIKARDQKFSMTSKEQFLADHNRLSPQNLQTTIQMLSFFRIEKTLLFKDDLWSIDKLRRPFIIWLTSLSADKLKSMAS